MPSLATLTRTLCSFVPLSFALACSSGRPADLEKPDASPLLTECASYERELRACFAAVGAPSLAADTFAATFSQRDEAARLRMEGACARDRARLRLSCR
jgi:hypothetical protein